MPEREHRAARNETVFRAANEGVVRTAGGAVDAVFVICECGDETCLDRLIVTPAEYEAVRAHCTRFLVAPGHEERTDESGLVVDETDRFVVVEKFGAAAAVATATDPRVADRR